MASNYSDFLLNIPVFKILNIFLKNIFDHLNVINMLLVIQNAKTAKFLEALIFEANELNVFVLMFRTNKGIQRFESLVSYFCAL